jgi:hypothetical protein
MITTPYMGLAAWNSVTDEWNHEQLASNFRKLDEHDHSGGKGLQIPTGGIEDGAVTTSKLAPSALAIGDNAVDTRHIKNGAVTAPKLGYKAVKTDNLEDLSVTSPKIQGGSVYSQHLGRATSRSVGLHPRGRGMVQFVPGIIGQNTQKVNVGMSPVPRNGFNGIKVKIPAGGGLLHIYAEGLVTVRPRPEPDSSDYIEVTGRISISSTTFSRTGTIGRFVSNGVNENRTGLWHSWAGAALSLPRSSVPGLHLATATGGPSGGPVSYFVPAGSEDLTVAVTLAVGSGGSHQDLEISYGQQTLAVWTSSFPTYTGALNENDDQYWSGEGI